MNISQMDDPTTSYIQQQFRGRTFGKEFVVEHGFLYDRIAIAAGGTLDESTSRWFHDVGAGSTKTIAQTNLTQSRKLDSPQSFSVSAIRLLWKSDLLKLDYDLIANSYAFEFYVADAWKIRGPIALFPAGGGPSTSLTTTINNGLATVEAVRVLDLPILIESGISFYARLAGSSNALTAGGGSNGTGFTCYCILEGLHARPTVG